MSKPREANFDLLRIISAFAVIVIHVSGGFLRYKDAVPQNCTPSLMILTHIVRFAVPCFLMLSGAFILDDERNADYKYFYKKSINNIGITSIVFCIVYVLYAITRLMVGVFMFKKHELDSVLPGLLTILKNFIKGAPFYHLWYLFTLIGLYLAAPFVIRLAADLKLGGVNLYGKIATVFLVISSVCYITSTHTLEWDIGSQLCFLSLFLMGYKIRKWGTDRKNNLVALGLTSAGVAVNVGLGCINLYRGCSGLQVDVVFFKQNLFSYGTLSPIEVAASCLIFAGFSVLEVKKDFAELAGYTFLIYLFHAGVWDVIATIIGSKLIGDQVVEAVSVIFISMVVFCISLLAAIIYKNIALGGHSRQADRIET